MYHKTRNFLPVFFLFVCLFSHAKLSHAENCNTSDRLCILNSIKTEAATITNQAWRDQTYRELAKTYAFDGFFDKAIKVIDLITTPDTKAMTIRGIGMTIAAQEHTTEEYAESFTALRAEAEKITHPPSYAIALTYIAMAQAFAGDNKGSWDTAAAMKNDALRNKAYGETAEIQAEKGNYNAAHISIQKINSESFRNKAYSIVSGILAANNHYNDAYASALEITNKYKKATALQHLLDAQKPRDVKH